MGCGGKVALRDSCGSCGSCGLRARRGRPVVDGARRRRPGRRGRASSRRRAAKRSAGRPCQALAQTLPCSAPSTGSHRAATTGRRGHFQAVTRVSYNTCVTA